MRYWKRTVALVLVVILTAGMFPPAAMAAPHDPGDVVRLSNDAIEVNVSRLNGGFTIKTTEGDTINKDDSNKDLLFHNGEYDTSFTSFRVTYANNTVRDYIFGADYHYAGLSSSSVSTTEDAGGITSVWSVDKIEFTQRIELANVGSLEHGMVSISYKVNNKNTQAITVEARILMDSALGPKDYAHYEILDTSNSTYRSVSSEQIISTNIPQNFFAYDDLSAPTITSYTVNDTALMPYKMAFGHWNSLAMTTFDFTPIDGLFFTTQGNEQFQTADSAFALYYELGSIAGNGVNESLHTFYGVYSNAGVRPAEAVAINTTAPTALELSADKANYISPDTGAQDGTFSVLTTVFNYVQTNAQVYKNIAVAIYPSTGIEALDSYGKPLGYTTSRADPLVIKVRDFRIQQTQSFNLYFKAHIQAYATYGKVDIRVFNLPDPSNEVLVQENLLGSSAFYVLLPGNDGALPTISFASAEQPILYYQGNRHMYLTGTNVDSLLAGGVESGSCAVRAYDVSDPTNEVTIPSEHIRFPGENAVDILFTQTMAEGTYQVVFDWQAGAVPDGVEDPLTSSNLRVTMSSDPAYRNEGYGILAIVQTTPGGSTGSDARYEILPFSDERAYLEALEKKYYGRNASGGFDFDEVLMTLRGQFIQERENNLGEPQEWKAVSLSSATSSGDANLANVISINNCIDFENGTLRVYYNGLDPTDNYASREILIDFDGDLYTSVARTSIWSGVAAFSAIENGKDYYLVSYDEEGTRISDSSYKEEITLIWPGAASLAQKVGGMLFNLTYAQMGVMYNVGSSSEPDVLAHEKPALIGHITSFGAKLDLSFLVKSNKTKDELEPSAWKRLKEMLGEADYDTITLRQMQAERPHDPALDEPNPKETKGVASVMVEDILFGLGKGFVGFNCDVNLTIPGYIEAMPNITGRLQINTIGNWSIGLDGKCQFTSITFETSVYIKSYKGVPIPDTLKLYVEGFPPGINLDGFGVLWLTGGGGGIENLYDTIFLASSVPPLKLLLSAQFSLLQVLQAQVNMGLSLRGFSLSMTDVSLTGTNVVIIPNAQISFDWYPSVKMVASVGVSLFGIVSGSGYIVCDVAMNDYEFFVRAKVSIPDLIPFVGGMSLGGVDLGVNEEKIWGSLEIIKIRLGITYFWGGSIDFGTGNEDLAPSYPELLYANNRLTQETTNKLLMGQNVPVYYDKERGETLYMTLGTNVALESEACVAPAVFWPDASGFNSYTHQAAWRTGQLSQAAFSVKPATETEPLISNSQKNEHSLYLASARFADKDAMVTVQFPASNEAMAEQAVADMVIEDSTQSPYTLVLFDTAEGADNANANAHLQYDAAKQLATLTFTMTDSSNLDKSWFIGTPDNSNVALYHVKALPDLKTITGTKDSDNIKITYSGTNLDEADEISFFLTEDATLEEDDVADMGTWIGTIDSPNATGGSDSFAIPASLNTGTYTLRALCVKEGSLNQSVIAADTIDFTNPLQPADPSISGVSLGGDLTLKLDLDTSNEPKGYIFNVYRDDNGTLELTDISGVAFEKVEDDQGIPQWPEFKVGGSYEFVDENGNSKTVGLVAGETYKVGVTAVNYEMDALGNPLYMIQSDERLSDSIEMQAPTPPVITVEASATPKTLERLEWGTDANGKAAELLVQHETFAQEDITLTFSSTENVTGSFWLNGEEYLVGGNAIVSGTSHVIPLLGLRQGDHVLEFVGTDDDGDSFRETYAFTVDTTPPTLQLSTPVNNSFFGQDNILTVEGLGDADALYTVVVDGVTLVEKKTISELQGTFDNGLFSFSVDMGEGNVSRQIFLIAEDEMGNATSQFLTVNNGGLGDIHLLTVVYSYNTSFIGDMNWLELDNRNIPIELAQLGIVLGVKVETKSGNTFIIPADNSRLEWDLQMLKGSASIDENGTLMVLSNSMGMIGARFSIGSDASYGAAATLGAQGSVTYGSMPALADHTITYDSNGGQGTLVDPLSPYLSYNEVTALANTFTKEGDWFDSWNTKRDGTGASYQPGDKFIITQDTVLYAQWGNEINGSGRNSGILPALGDAVPWILLCIVALSVGAMLYSRRKKIRKAHELQE